MKRIFRQNEIYVFFIMIILMIVITGFNRYFFTLENFFDLLRGHSFEGILAIGFFMVLLSGGIDVSFTAVAVVGMYLGVMTVVKTGINNIWLAIAVAVFVGLILGAINAVFIGVFKIPTLITTLGTLTAYQGALMSYLQATHQTVISNPPQSVINFGKAVLFRIERPDGKILELSIFSLIFIGITIITWLILKYTTLGRSIKALGGNMEAARRAGINILGTQFFIYCYVGALAGIAGLMLGSYLRYVDPLYLVGNELTIIAAVVLGGASIMGGRGTIIGTVLGISVITIINTSLVLMKIPSYFQQAVIGGIIVISVSITAYRQKLRERQTRVLDVT
ncbi:MAG: ABC transporter permease [Actinobacteria bacterium]|nr:ABC transporter permease [Actinomycetota bacterium]